MLDACWEVCRRISSSLILTGLWLGKRLQEEALLPFTRMAHKFLTTASSNPKGGPKPDLGIWQ